MQACILRDATAKTTVLLDFIAPRNLSYTAYECHKPIEAAGTRRDIGNSDERIDRAEKSCGSPASTLEELPGNACTYFMSAMTSKGRETR